MKNRLFLKAMKAIAIMASSIGVNAQTYSFTNCGVTGQNGPTQADVTTEYTSTTLDGDVSINTQGIQEWTVPVSGTYEMTAIGACGGESLGTYYPGLPGSGATTEGSFYLDAGTVIKVIVGQMGLYADNGTGGGGGSFVYTNAIGGSDLMMVAGGGGGTGHGSNPPFDLGPFGGGGSATTSPVDGANDNGNGGSLGIGEGGAKGVAVGAYGQGAGGAGWLSSGEDMMDNGFSATGGNQSTMQGGVAAGGTHGGFGGGGSADGSGTAGGGGGGYSGGGGGNDWTGQIWGAGAGAGSYNVATNAQNTAGVTGFVGPYYHGAVEFVYCPIQFAQNTLPDIVVDCSLSMLAEPSATSGCGYMITVSSDANLPIVTEGTTVVTWTYTDEFGAEATQTQNIIVNNSVDNSVSVLDSVLTAGQSGATYQWLHCDNGFIAYAGATDQDFTASVSGNYAVVVDLGGVCLDTSACITVCVEKEVVIFQNGVDLTAPLGYTNYQWYDDAGMISGANTNTYTATSDGDYSCEVTDSIGCISLSEEVTVVGSSIKDVSFDVLNVYPNPTTGIVNIEVGNEDITSIRVIDLSGRTVKQYGNETQINVSDITTGIYILEIANAEKRSIVKLIVR